METPQLPRGESHWIYSRSKTCSANMRSLYAVTQLRRYAELIRNSRTIHRWQTVCIKQVADPLLFPTLRGHDWLPALSYMTNSNYYSLQLLLIPTVKPPPPPRRNVSFSHPKQHSICGIYPFLREQLLRGYFSCDCLDIHVAQFE